MIEYSAQVNNMCPITKGPKHGPAPIPEEGQWVKAYKIEDISGYTHGVGWCAPQQGTCKLSLNIKNGIIEEALVETIGCSGMTHSAAMAGEILPGKTILEALNTDLSSGTSISRVRAMSCAACSARSMLKPTCWWMATTPTPLRPPPRW